MTSGAGAGSAVHLALQFIRWHTIRTAAACSTFLSIQPIVPLKPNPDHHRTDDSPAKELTTGRSVRERARARPRSAQNVENPPLEVAPTQTTVGSTRRSAAVCGGLGSRVKKEPKKAYRDFQAIRRKGVVQGQSCQALMPWRGRGILSEGPPPQWGSRSGAGAAGS